MTPHRRIEMAKGTVIDRIADENGDLAILSVAHYQDKDKWYIERIGEAFTPRAGQVIHTNGFNSEKEARDEFENLRLYYIDPEA